MLSILTNLAAQLRSKFLPVHKEGKNEVNFELQHIHESDGATIGVKNVDGNSYLYEFANYVPNANVSLRSNGDGISIQTAELPVKLEVFTVTAARKAKVKIEVRPCPTGATNHVHVQVKLPQSATYDVDNIDLRDESRGSEIDQLFDQLFGGRSPNRDSDVLDGLGELFGSRASGPEVVVAKLRQPGDLSKVMEILQTSKSPAEAKERLDAFNNAPNPPAAETETDLDEADLTNARTKSPIGDTVVDRGATETRTAVDPLAGLTGCARRRKERELAAAGQASTADL